MKHVFEKRWQDSTKVLFVKFQDQKNRFLNKAIFGRVLWFRQINLCLLGGRLYTSAGKEAEKDKYMGGTIFVDDASGMMFYYNQVSLNAQETLWGKHHMEREALRHGIEIHAYRANNGICILKWSQRKRSSNQFLWCRGSSP